MQITVPPGARVIIETQTGEALTLAPPAQPRRIGAGIAVAVIAFAAGMAASHLQARTPAQAANPPAPAITLPPQPPAQQPTQQANPFGLKP